MKMVRSLSRNEPDVKSLGMAVGSGMGEDRFLVLVVITSIACVR